MVETKLNEIITQILSEKDIKKFVRSFNLDFIKFKNKDKLKFFKQFSSLLSVSLKATSSLSLNDLIIQIAELLSRIISIPIFFYMISQPSSFLPKSGWMRIIRVLLWKWTTSFLIWLLQAVYL